MKKVVQGKSNRCVLDRTRQDIEDIIIGCEHEFIVESDSKETLISKLVKKMKSKTQIKHK